MEFFCLIITMCVIGEVIRAKHSLWAANLFMSICWIGMGYVIALGLNEALALNEIDKDTYKETYGMCYISSIVGCFYLLPVFLGIGKKKRPIKKENEL
jgi:hypothetical protein